MPPTGSPVTTGFDIIAHKIKDVASKHASPSSSTVAASMATTGRLLGSSFQESSGRAKVVPNSLPTGGSESWSESQSESQASSAKRRRTGLVTPASSRQLASGSVEGSIDSSTLRLSSSGSVVSSLSGSSTIPSPTNLFRGSRPLDDDVVPPHPTITPSVTMPILKRLLPDTNPQGN